MSIHHRPRPTTTKHSTAISKTKIKTSTSTSIQQTFNILQNVFECSIAGICKDRHLFPKSFFEDFETNDLNVTKFDLEFLLDGDNDVESEDGDEGDHNENDDNVHDVEFDNTEKENEWNYNYSNTENETGKNGQSLPELSPLTVNSYTSSTSTYLLKRNATIATQPPTKINNDSNNNKNDRYYKNEALLLLHWIRNGVLEMIKRDQLARFIFAICVPSCSTSSSSHSKSYLALDDKDNNMNATIGRKRRRLNRDKVEDQIIESFVVRVMCSLFIHSVDSTYSSTADFEYMTISHNNMHFLTVVIIIILNGISYVHTIV